MGLSADHLTPPGSPIEDSKAPQQYTLRFAADHDVSLPKNKSTSNLLSQRDPPLAVNTKRLSIDAGQLDRMVR
ncbi:hypothetical protein DM02DRAFT_612577 [Periconia macrospinosa]|uniref:Uncharacterized protein n=1 Tax=Periconia macrospinosa TaxID=97972 RepID=A0A2V1DXL4_9PLEO|nr:hypothetical protein DM02DRAFT_612577 [Periconia macrospinosa]